MKPIEGILPGSKIKAYAYHHGFSKPTSWTFTLENDGRLWCGDEWAYEWKDIELTELAAYDSYLAQEEKRLTNLIENFNKLKLQRDNYRDPTVVSAEKIAKYNQHKEDLKIEQQKRDDESDRMNTWYNSPG